MPDILGAYKAGKSQCNVFDTNVVDFKETCPEPTIPSFITSDKHWSNYTNQKLYETEVAFRKWHEEKCKDSVGCHSRYARRYTAGMLIKEIFGREYRPGDVDHVIAKMFRYYSTKVAKGGTIRGKKIKEGRSIYHISARRPKIVKPFCLRLQEEGVLQEGRMPNGVNVRIKDKYVLEPGHARSPRTEANMQRRKKEAKERGAAYQYGYRNATPEEREQHKLEVKEKKRIKDEEGRKKCREGDKHRERKKRNN